MEIEYTVPWRKQAAVESNYTYRSHKVNKEELQAHLGVAIYTLQKSQNDLLIVLKAKLPPEQVPAAEKRLNEILASLEKLKALVA